MRGQNAVFGVGAGAPVYGCSRQFMAGQSGASRYRAAANRSCVVIENLGQKAGSMVYFKMLLRTCLVKARHRYFEC
jgi:hypothetical protein